MKKFTLPLIAVCLLVFNFSCDKIDDFIGDGPGDEEPADPPMETAIDFSLVSTFVVDGEDSAEITAFDPTTNKLFVTNGALNEITVFDISDVQNPLRLDPIICTTVGTPNSVAVSNGILAVALAREAVDANGVVELFSTETQEGMGVVNVGVLPDMVAFTPNGAYILTANEGEPNDDYSIDAEGSVSIVNVETRQVSTLSFAGFNGMEESLEEEGFRVFGPHATLAEDVEPEFLTVSDDGTTAWVALQENNGIAVVDIASKQITEILPLGFKDFSLQGNEIDPSNRDDRLELRSVPAFGMYQPDAIDYYSVNGMDFIVTANEGDGREYEGDPGFVEVFRVGDDEIVLDAEAFPDFETLQLDENLGRLEVTNTLGDTDGDGDFDELYAFGARSFSIWSGQGQLVFDSGNQLASIALELTPEAFNGGVGNVDSRSDDAGPEPEAVSVQQIGDRQILFVGLERNSQVMVFDITNPSFPEFVQLLFNPSDIGPEGVLPVAAADSPTGKELVIVSSEVSGTISIYEN